MSDVGLIDVTVLIHNGFGCFVYSHEISTMIERCTKKRMIFSIVLLIGLSVAIVLLEHHLTTLSYSNHHITVTGVENLPTVANNQCWLSENFSVAHECQPCSDFEKASKFIPSCETNGHKEKVHCDISGDTFRSCPRVLWLEEKHFWTLELVSLVVGLFSSMFVMWRHKILEYQMMKKIQQQTNCSY